MHPSRALFPSHSLDFSFAYGALILAVLKNCLKGMPRLLNLQNKCSHPSHAPFQSLHLPLIEKKFLGRAVIFFGPLFSLILLSVILSRILSRRVRRK